MINSDCLAHEDSLGGNLNPEIVLHNVKSNPITKLRDGDKIAHLLPLANPPLSLPSNGTSVGHRLQSLSPGWKNLAMAESIAPISPRCALLTIIETE
jgi:hypothetical protein